MTDGVMKNLMRIVCVLIAGLLAACGGGGGESGGAASTAPPKDTRLVLDHTVWDQGDWAE